MIGEYMLIDTQCYGCECKYKDETKGLGIHMGQFNATLKLLIGKQLDQLQFFFFGSLLSSYNLFIFSLYLSQLIWDYLLDFEFSLIIFLTKLIVYKTQ